MRISPPSSRILAAGLLASLLTASSLAAQTYVDAGAVGLNDGSSWADAYVDLQNALAATTTGEIWVAQGTYFPGLPGDTLASFELKDGVALYGGFFGNETQLSQRDVAAYPTVLSGDIDQDDNYGSGIEWWRWGWGGMTTNSGNVVDASNVGLTAVLDGFTIMAGYGYNSSYWERGAGLLAVNGSPTVRNTTFRYNSYAYGASAYLAGSQAVFEDCDISDGYTFARTASGVNMENGSDVTFERCRFYNHYTVTTMGYNDGSAMYTDFDCAITLIDCDFIANRVGNWFAMGDPSGSYGGGVMSRGTLYADRCAFIDNYAHAGAGVYAMGPTTILNSLFAENYAHSYPVESWIDDGDYGAGLAVLAFQAYPVEVVNCTFVDNYCDKGAGIWASTNTPVNVRNSILYWNNGPAPFPGEDQVPHLLRQYSGSIDLQNSCVQDLWKKIPNEDPVEASAHPGCFDQDPKFTDYVNRDYSILPSSPCIDSGRDGAVPPGITMDLDGNPRLQGGPVDVGSTEFAGAPQPSITSTSFITEITTQVNVFNANPNETVHLLYSMTGTGLGPSVPQLGGLNLGILHPVTLFQSKQANAEGKASFPIPLPPSAPLVDVYLQAAMARGAGGNQSVLTDTVSQTIYLKP